MRPQRLVHLLFVSFTLAGLSLACATTAPKDSSGNYQYSDRQLERNREALQSYGQGSGSTQSVASAAFFDAQQGTDAKSNVRYIEGICWIDPAPCVGLTLLMTEEGTKKILKMKTENSGRFLFVINPQAKYSIQVESGSYSSRFEKPAPYQAGDHVVIHLSAIQPALHGSSP